MRSCARTLRYHIARISGPSYDAPDRASGGTAKTLARGARIFDRTADTGCTTCNRAARRDRAMRCDASCMVCAPTCKPMACVGGMR